MTTKIQRRSGEFRKSYTEELDASCCIYMKRQSSKICANHPVTGWKPSRVIGRAFIPFALMISGESFSGGKVATLMMMCMSSIITDDGGCFYEAAN